MDSKIRPAASDRLQKADCRPKTYFNQRGNNFHTVHLSLSLSVHASRTTLYVFFFPPSSFYFSDQSVISPGWLSGSTFRTVNLTSTKVVLIKDDRSCERTCLCAFL